MNYATSKVEFSQDPLSDTTPSWTDVTQYVRSVDWFSGKQRDLDDPQAGGATIVLKNDQRRFEPEYAAGAYYPNIVPLRRFRLTMTADGSSHSEGVFYATSWDVTYPAQTAYSEVVVTCVDGFGLLSLDILGPLDPPDAATIADVIAFDSPFAYYRMNETAGTTLIARKARKQHHHHHRHHRHHHHQRPAGTFASEGFGPDGVYFGAPIFGEPGLVVGDADTSVQLRDDAGAYVRIPLAGTGQFAATNQFTIECIYKPNTESTAGSNELMLGPWNTLYGHSFDLSASIGASDQYSVDVQFSSGGGVTLTGPTYTHGTTHHLAATWDSVTLTLYVDGAVVANSGSYAGKTINLPGVIDYLYIGGSSHVAHMAAGWIDEAAFWERALPATRIKAHADAALNRGYNQQVEGDRITAIVTSDLWSESKIDTGQFQVAPVMMTGQAKLDEVTRTTHAAEPWAQFYFDGVGDPVYLGWDYLSVGSRSTVTATFGDTGGEVPYTDIVLTYDDEIYNSVTISGDSGLAQTASDATSQAAYRTRGLVDTGLALVNDSDAASVAATIRDGYANPAFRCDAITLNGAQSMSRTQILTRDIGDLIRVRRRGVGGTPIDVVTRIIGKSKSFTPDGNLTCTWSLARGLNAADGYWHEGVTGFSELGQTTVLA